MKRPLHIFAILFLLCTFTQAQEEIVSEQELKEKANQYFEADNFAEAKPLFAQLLSLYPKDPNYNYKFGACLLNASSDKEEPLKYLEFAITKRSAVDNLAQYYLGKAYHLNYNFAKAVKAYSRFKRSASAEQMEKYMVDRQIEMCKNGNQLLSRLNDVQVIDRQVIDQENFFRIYDLQGIDGKIIAKPSDFRSKYDEKINERSIIYLPNDAKEVYYSSYGKKGENGKDIYKSVKVGESGWSEGVALTGGVNTPYDEDYPFIHPDGRTLFFASKGHSSMGGYDLFKSTFDSETNSWRAPENMDFAFSSADDDILFITDANQVLAYFASNRSNESGQITVYKVLVEKAPAAVTVIKGKFIAENKPDLKTATITVVDPASNETVGVFKTNDNGNYSIEIDEKGGTYKFLVETTEDAPIHTSTIVMPDQDVFEVLGQELRLVEKDGEEQLVIKNIFDGTTAANLKGSGPQVSPSLLRRKAKLDVNYDPSQLAGIIEERNAKTTSSDPPEGPEVQAGTTIDAAQLEELNGRLKALKEEWTVKEDKSADVAFNTSVGMKKNADEEFKTFDQLKSTNADSTAIADKLQEAKETALAAAYAARLGEKLEQAEQKRVQMNSEVQKSIAEVEAALSSNQTELANTLLTKLEGKSASVPTKSMYFEQSKASVEEDFLSKNTALMDLMDRGESFAAEEAQINEELKELDEKLKTITGQERVELQTREEELQLDAKDLAYRIERNKEEQAQLSEEVAALGIEKSVYDKIDESLQSNELSESISADDKAQLMADLRAFEDNGQLAFSDIETPQEEDVPEIISEGVQTSTIDAASSTIQEINQHYEEQLNLLNEVGDDDLKGAQRISVYNQWIEGLQQKLVEKENDLTLAQGTEERNQVQGEMDELLELINLKQNVRDNLNTSLADNSGITQSEVDATKREEEIDEVAEIESTVAAPANIEDVDQFTVIDDAFSNFTFDQTYDVGNQEESADLLNAKRSLYEASSISKQAEEAREAAYNLPTIEERQNAFDRANDLEKLSEAKQMEASDYFAAYNQREYEINANRLNNANEYDEAFESNNLDIANLLAEEAEVYIQNAAEIRASIDPNARLSRTQADLQKAYDFEMLALNKQKEALKILKIVDDEYVNRATLASQIDNQVPIENDAALPEIKDPEVLAVSDPEIAKQNAVELNEAVVELKRAIEEQMTAVESLPVGAERDSLLAQVDQMEEEALAKEAKAINFNIREQQIRQAEVETAKEENAKIAAITKPRKVAQASVVELDTVDVSEEQERLLIESSAFNLYAKSDQQNKQLLKEAETEYAKAVSLTKEKIALEKQAIVERAQADAQTDPEEKERLIKSAELIELNAANKQSMIDSIETIVKIKNYLVAANENKKQNALASISQEEKQALLITYNKYENDPVLAEWVDLTPSDSLSIGGSTLTSSETSETIDPLGKLDTEIGEVPLSESAIEDERTDDGISELKYNERPEGGNTGIEGGRERYPNANSGTSSAISTARPAESTPVTLPAITLEKIDKIPSVVDRPIFMRIDNSQSAYSEARPIPVDIIMPEGLVYKVQIGAFRNPIPQDLFKGFAPLMAETTSSGITRYTAGFFLSETVAVQARDEIRSKGYPDAFVVAFMNGERISISKARNSGGGEASPEEIEAFQAEAPASSVGSVVPSSNVQKVAGGSQEGLPQAFKEAGTQPVVNTKTIDGLIYTVQVGVYSKALSSGTFDYVDMHVVQLSNGLYRYNAGKYTSAIEAAEAKIEIQANIKDAFVVAYYKGERISLNEASRLLNDN